MKNVSDKFLDKIKSHFLCSITFSLSEIVSFIRQCGKLL